MSGPAVFAHPRELLGATGRVLPFSDWFTMTQEVIDGFAAVTLDRQWIHVDVARAAQGPFGSTIAHGYLTLSLVNHFLPQMLEVRGVFSGINIGTDRLRFLAPVRVGSRIRGGGEVLSAEEVRGGAIQAVVRVTVEIEGGDRPACVVDTISRYIPE